MTNLTENVKLCDNVRHLTLASKEYKKPDISLHITAKYLLPASKILKTVRVESGFLDRHFQNHNSEIARIDSKTFVLTLDGMLGVIEEWMQQERIGMFGLGERKGRGRRLR